jgi:hypothetical protein
MTPGNEVAASLHRYVQKGIPTGGFLEAVLSNDLFGALARADETNRTRLFEIVSFIHCFLPSRSHGSPERVSDWIKHRGLEGLEEAEGGGE